MSPFDSPLAADESEHLTEQETPLRSEALIPCKLHERRVITEVFQREIERIEGSMY